MCGTGTLTVPLQVSCQVGEEDVLVLGLCCRTVIKAFDGWCTLHRHNDRAAAAGAAGG